MNRAERRARGRRGREPVWCDCCQDAPAEVTLRECSRCGFVEVLSSDDPVMFAAMTSAPFWCPNCDVEAEP